MSKDLSFTPTFWQKTDSGRWVPSAAASFYASSRMAQDEMSRIILEGGDILVINMKGDLDMQAKLLARASEQTRAPSESASKPAAPLLLDGPSESAALSARIKDVCIPRGGFVILSNFRRPGDQPSNGIRFIGPSSAESRDAASLGQFMLDGLRKAMRSMNGGETPTAQRTPPLRFMRDEFWDLHSDVAGLSPIGRKVRPLASNELGQPGVAIITHEAAIAAMRAAMESVRVPQDSRQELLDSFTVELKARSTNS